MLTYISADYVFPVVSPPLACGVLGIAPDGTIAEVWTSEQARANQIKDIVHYEGMLVPGFVNTHCHLELSHLKGQIPKHTGLPRFVEEVIKQRASTAHAVDEAMMAADAEMRENGIVAVGDIANQAVSAELKAASQLYYHTFVELLGFNPALANTVMERGMALAKKFEPSQVSIAPHAPYSVSAELFTRLKIHGDALKGLSTMHNQETQDENAFFESKTGAFLQFFEFLKLDTTFFRATGKSSLQSVLPQMSLSQKLLLVHNVFTSAEDIEFANSLHPQLYWCLCPNANLYIENRLPDLTLLRQADLKITLGTDSLASNDSLSIFAEMQTLQKHCGVSLHNLLYWATYNGAEFLGITETYGSLERGKRPGVNLLEYSEVDGSLALGEKMKRLF